MRLAADMILRNECLDIAQSLAKSSKDGHIQSAKFLFDLADEHQKLGTAEITRRLHNLAIDLAAEPEWPGILSEETAETAIGSREPEG